MRDATTRGTMVAQSHSFALVGEAADPHDGTPVQQVQILVDGVAVGNATLGLPSTALAAKYNNPAFAHGGWTFTGPPGLSLGAHSLTVMASDSLGLSTVVASGSFDVTE